MKLCLITREYPPELPTAGIGTYIKTLANVCSAKGNEVHVVCGTKRKSEYEYVEDGIRVYRLPWNPIGRLNILPHLRYCLKIAKKVAKIYRANGIDIIEVPDYLGQGIFLKALGLKCPIVVRFHGGQEIELKSRVPLRPSFYFMFLLEIIAALFSNAGTAPSKAAANFARKKLYYKNISILPNFIKISEEYNKTENSKTKGRNQIIFVGRLDENKGPHLLCKAIRKLFYTYPTLKIFFIGPDAFFKKKKMAMSKYCSAIIPEEFRANIIFTGYLPHHQVLEHMKEGDVFCLPSLSETFGLVVLEAMSCGLPVVCFKGTSLDEIITDSKNGFLVPQGNVESLTHYISLLLSNPNLRWKMGELGEKTVLEKFSKKNIINAYEKYYAELVSRYHV